VPVITKAEGQAPQPQLNRTLQWCLGVKRNKRLIQLL
jgi:hypothetical protein